MQKGVYFTIAVFLRRLFANYDNSCAPYQNSRSARSISYPYFNADVSSCFAAHKHGERIIDWTWEDKGANADVVPPGCMKMAVHVDLLIEEKVGGGCSECLWIANEFGQIDISREN